MSNRELIPGICGGWLKELAQPGGLNCPGWMLAALVIVWSLAVGAGMRVMLQYENSPTAATSPPVKWPTDSQIKPRAGLPTLVLMAHPRCPCTRASIGELAVLMALLKKRLSAHVFLYKPSGALDEWAKTDLWFSADALPGVEVHIDESGAEANRFHAIASGQTFLYDQQGILQFQGGITPSRGHSGDNAGRDAIVSFVRTGQSERKKTFVFGCYLSGPNTPQGDSLWK